ncbi:MAG: hypothetical protein ACD_22C00241G0006, partial [uncultured bacterium]
TSDIVNKLVFDKNPPDACYLVMQKEAAMRFMGIGEGTLISLLIKPFFELKVEYEFAKSDFVPSPSVDVVLFSIIKKDHPLIKSEHLAEYKKFVNFTLNQQKPSLKLRLNKIFTSEQFYRLSKNLRFSIDATAQDLSFEQWLGLFEYYQVGVSKEKKRI